MPKKFLVFLVLALLFVPSAFAVISSQRAIDFVTKENYYLYDNESGQLIPSVKVKNIGQYYWLFGVSSGEIPSAYIPVADQKDISVPANEAIQRALFKAADIMWYISKFKANASQDQWFFSASNTSFFTNLSQILQNEPIDLDLVKSDLKDTKANAEILLMNAAIVSMSTDSEELSKKITAAIASDSAFFSDPDAAKLDQFRGTFNDAFELAKKLNEETISYDASVTKLKTLISNSATLDSGKKSQLVSFADPPQQLLQVSSKATVAASVQQAIDSAFASSVSRSKDLVENLALRIKRNNAARALKASDDAFLAKTGGKFDSLESAAGTILSDEYSSLWKNQQKLSEFSDNYSKAKSSLEKGNFDSSLTYSAKAKAAAVLVLNGGFADTTPAGIDWNVWIYFAVGVIALFALIYFIRNRGKLSTLVQQQDSEKEEVKIYGWEKR